MAKKAVFSWEGSHSVNSTTLGKRLKVAPKNLDKAITAIIDLQATRAEAYAKRKAPWTDRTGNARNGLFTRAIHSEKEHAIVVAHSVPYGIWLEVANGGHYEIIDKTLLYTIDKTMGMITRILDKLAV